MQLKYYLTNYTTFDIWWLSKVATCIVYVNCIDIEQSISRKWNWSIVQIFEAFWIFLCYFFKNNQIESSKWQHQHHHRWISALVKTIVTVKGIESLHWCELSTQDVQHMNCSVRIFLDGFASIQHISTAKSHVKKVERSEKIYALKIQRIKRSKMFCPYQIYVLESRTNYIHGNEAR